jgi:hypothetical protein
MFRERIICNDIGTAINYYSPVKLWHFNWWYNKYWHIYMPMSLMSTVYIIRGVICPTLENRSTQHKSCVVELIPIWLFHNMSVCVTILTLICLITLRYVVRLLNLHLTTYPLYDLWSLFKIPWYLIPPIICSFRAHARFYLGTIRRFSLK